MCMHVVCVCRVSFSFFPKGGQNEIVWSIGEGQNEIEWTIGGGKYVSVCKVCGKLGGVGNMLPWE